MKLYYLMIVSVLLSSCSLIISDEDGDGVSNGSRFITKIYSDRKIKSFHSLVDGLKPESSSVFIWHVGDEAVELDTTWNPHKKYLRKSGVTYEWIKTSDNKNYAIYQIRESETPSDVSKYVVMTVEALPIFDENPAILLISNEKFTSDTEAKTYGDANVIPELSITIPFLDLVFDPDTLVIEDDNMAEHLAAITTKYTLLEIFGRKSVEEKRVLLEKYDYETLLPVPLP